MKAAVSLQLDCSRRHPCAAMAQDHQAVFIAPIVDGVF